MTPNASGLTREQYMDVACCLMARMVGDLTGMVERENWSDLLLLGRIVIKDEGEDRGFDMKDYSGGMVCRE